MGKALEMFRALKAKQQADTKASVPDIHDQVQEAMRRLDAQGWFAIWSEVAGGTVLLARDLDRIPESLRNRFPAFTLSEAAKLNGPEAVRKAYADRAGSLKAVCANA